MIRTGARLEPALPPHCTPANDFLLRFSSTFHVCVPSELAFISNTLGILSIAAWLSAQLPQIWKNYHLKSTSGLSIYFLVEWCLGDLSNLLGAVFTHQQPWQITLAAYYVFVDLCLVLQWVWYEHLQHGTSLLHVRSANSDEPPSARADMHQVVVGGTQPLPPPPEAQPVTKKATRPRPIFRTPTFDSPRTTDGEKNVSATPGGTKVYRVGPSQSYAASPRTVLLIACLIAVVRASPVSTSLVLSMQQSGAHATQATSLEVAGTILSWISTVLYVGSRLPQIFKNWSRKSTAGLSAHLFAAAFCGNLFYSAAIATNPSAWNDFAPYGGGGWAGPEGSKSRDWVFAALPFFLGAAGVLGLDATIGLQFVVYGGDEMAKVVVVENGEVQRGKWRRVSGWMRGWIPSVREAEDREGRPLLESTESAHDEGYGTLS